MKRTVIKVVSLVLVAALCAAGVYAYMRYNEGKDDTAHHDFKITLPRIDTGKYPDENTKELADRPYSVSTSNDIATAVGMSVLEAGGNAVDAAIAVSRPGAAAAIPRRSELEICK